MNDKKKWVAMLFGGQSAEHDISIQSARFVEAALQRAGFEILLIGIDREGIWRLAPRVAAPQPNWPTVVMLPGMGGKLLLPNNPTRDLRVDTVFPVLHGPCGEDGSVQGLLQLCRVPFVGCSVLSGALCMDKIFAKQILTAAGLPTVQSIWMTQQQVIPYSQLTTKLGDAVFVKPANMGSSIGVSRVDSSASYARALLNAFKYDSRVLVETAIVGREIECAVLSDDGFKASVPGEVVVNKAEFYDFEAKYTDENGARLICPAELPESIVARVQALSIAASLALGCEGLVRVDFFLLPDGSLLINELNTLPGFTEISMYPKMWRASGLTDARLAEALVQHAIDRFNETPRSLARPMPVA